MYLNNTDESIVMWLGEAILTSQLDVQVNFVYYQTGSVAINGMASISTGTTQATIVAAGSNAEAKQVREISIYNKDTATHVVYVSWHKNVTDTIIAKQSVPAGSTLHYAEQTGWNVIPAVGSSGGGGGGTADGIGGQVIVAASDAPAIVKARAYLTCDGIADQEQINLALSTLGVSAHVMLSQGTFNITSPILINQHGTTLVGSGVGQKAGSTQVGPGTTIKAAAGFTGLALVQVLSGSTIYPVYGCTLRDFTVDCDLQGTTSHGVYFSSNRGLINHVHVFDAMGDGFIFNGVAGWDTYDSVITESQASGCGGAGLHFFTDSPDCHSIGNVFFDNRYGIHIQSASEQITNCHTYNNTDYNFYLNNSGSRTKVVGCKIEGSGKHGVFMDSSGGNGTSDVQFVGNNFKNSGDSADNTYDHVNIAGLTAASHSRAVFSGNTFSYQSSVTPNKPRYAINLTGSVAQGITIVGNAFGPSTHWGTGVIFDNSSDTNPALIRANKGYLDDSYVIYVKDFGAKNDGFTDAAVAIQAALDAVPVGGGIVQFDEGSYEIRTPLVITKDGTVLRGAGYGNRLAGTQDGWGTRLSADPTFVGANLILWQRALDDRTLFGGGIRDMSLDGASVAALKGVVGKVESANFQNVAFHQFPGDALTLQGYASWKAEYNQIDNCYFTTLGDSAIVLGTDSKDTRITKNVFETVADKGVDIQTSGHLIHGNIFRSITMQALLFNNSGNRVRVTNNHFSGIGRETILFDNTTTGFSDVTVSGNTFEDSGITTTNTYDTILFGSTATAISRIAITGNAFLNSNANKPRYGVNYPGSGSQNNLLVGNTFGPASHWGTGPVNDNSNATTPTLIQNNVGFLRDLRAVSKSTTYTAVPLDDVLVVTAGASDKTITLPTAVGAQPRAMTIIRADGAVGNVIIDGNAAETINGAATKTLGAQYSAITILPFNSNWLIMNQVGTVT